MDLTYLDKNGNIINFYTLFNLKADAGQDEIKSAFRNLIKRYHPDLTGSHSRSNTEKINLIIRAYRILSDETRRSDYDRALFYSGRAAPDGRIIISKKRIRYSASLADMLRDRFLPKKITRKDILKNYGQDVEIFITPTEAATGAVAYVELPAKMICPLCMGSDNGCHVCRGIGRINTSSQLEVRIPPHVDDSTFIDVDLLSVRPDRYTTFSHGRLRIKITLIAP